MVGPIFLERVGELDLLSELVTELASSGGHVVLIRGEAGIGKSTLVREFVRSLREGSYVLVGACDDLIIPQPLGPFWDMARTEPSLRSPLGEGDRPRVLQAILDLLSRPRPTVLVIEDTQWADEATLDSIRYIGRRIAETNGVLMVTYRDGEVDYDHPLRGVIGDIPAQRVRRIQLGGLSLESVSVLVAGADLDPAEVLAATRGNPFLVREMSSAADERFASSLHDAVMARVQKLSSRSQGMLRTLAVIPEPIQLTDALTILGVDGDGLDECAQRGLLELESGSVSFRHELIRQTIESSLPAGERVSRNQAVLDSLPEDRYASLLINCAVEARSVDRLLELAPRSARYAAATGSHVQAARDYRELGPYLDRVDPDALGPLIEDWAREEYLVDDIPEAIRLHQLARARYRAAGDRRSESRTLASAAMWHEAAGQHRVARALAHEAVAVLGPVPAGTDLARALEVSTYLHAMAGDATATFELVERTLQAGGPGIDESLLIRTINHRGWVLNISGYPDGSALLEESYARAVAAGNLYEAWRALTNLGWGASEHEDLPVAVACLQRSIAIAAKHELPFAENHAKADYARVLELRGDWSEASDLARELLDAATITQLLALPVIGQIEARRSRPTAWSFLSQAWELASATDEFHRIAPAAIALAEHAWCSGDASVDKSQLADALRLGLAQGYRWSTGKLALWMWMLGALTRPPDGIAEPFEALMSGDVDSARLIFEARGVPYERALAMMFGSQAEQFEALDAFESLGADTVAARHRRSLRQRGIAVPRGRGVQTRRHRAGLTARQAEVLGLLAVGLTNHEIADRLFISPRTAEHHVAALLDKLDAATREEAVARAQREGLLSTDT